MKKKNKKTLIAPGVYLEDGPGYHDLREWDENGELVRGEPSTISDTCFCGVVHKDGGRWERCRCDDIKDYNDDERFEPRRVPIC